MNLWVKSLILLSLSFAITHFLLNTSKPSTTKKYYLVEVSYFGRHDDDDHQYQMVMTGEEYARAKRFSEREAEGYWFYDSSIRPIFNVTKAEYEKWKERLGGIGAYSLLNGDYINELDEEARMKLEKEMEEEKGKYYLIDVFFRPLPETIRNETRYKMMLTDEEMKAWGKVVENYMKTDRSGEDPEEREVLPSVYVFEEVSEQEYYKFKKHLGGLHKYNVLADIKSVLASERRQAEGEGFE